MAIKREQFLRQLGITEWLVRRPTLLQGELAIRISKNIRLIIIATQPLNRADPLLNDVMYSMSLMPNHVLIISQKQAAMLPENTKCHSWQLDIKNIQFFAGVTLHSAALNTLYQDANAKRELWQQICDYEKDMLPNNG